MKLTASRWAMLCLLSFALSHESYSQIVGGNAFMQGTYIELGVSACGGYNSSVAADSSYHANMTTGKLGLVADPDADGWTTGTPDRSGDFFIPGAPIEGFGLKFRDTNYLNNANSGGCVPNDILGAITSYSATGTNNTVTWEGSVGDINVVQLTTFEDNQDYIYTEVQLCNLGSTTIDSLYYARFCDPDNEVLKTGSYATTNTVIKQNPIDGEAYVQAVGNTYGVYLGMGTRDDRAKVAHGYGISVPTDIEWIYEAPYYWYDTGTINSDRLMAIAWLFDSLAPGECVCLSFVYVTDSASADDALDLTDSSGVTCDYITHCPCLAEASFTYCEDSCEFCFESILSDIGCWRADSYLWDFGDGDTSSAANPCHTYTTNGLYKVTLTITSVDTADSTRVCVATFSKKIYVDCGECECDVSPYFVATVDTCTISAIDLCKASACTKPIAWHWDFGDGKTDSAASVTHTYDSNGTYIVCMSITATTTEGDTCEYIYCDTIEITECDTCTCDLVPYFEPTVDSCVVTATDLCERTDCVVPIAWLWDFGDGRTATTGSVTHRYDTAGTYVICMTVWGLKLDGSMDTCEFRYYDTVTVDSCGGPCECDLEPYFEPVVDSCTMYATDLCERTDCVVPFRWLWDFGDGDTATTGSVRHRYDTAGTYIICMTVWAKKMDSSGDTCVFTYCDTVVIDSCHPCSCDLEPYFVPTVDSCTFSATDLCEVTDCVLPVAWLWDFGDGTTSTGGSVTHTYDSNGTYVVCMTVWGILRDGSGDTCEFYYCDTIEITECDTCECELVPYFIPVIDSCTVYATDLCERTWCEYPVKWVWTWGDGDTTYTGATHHRYDSAGTYVICLEVWSRKTDGSTDSCYYIYCDTVEIEDCDSCYCDMDLSFNPIIDSCSVYVRPKGDETDCVEPFKYLWDFGDGTTSDVSTVIHTYDSNGRYIICLTVWGELLDGSGDTCIETYCDTIEVSGCDTCSCDLVPYFVPVVDSCTVHVNDLCEETLCVEPIAWHWDFGDGGTASSVIATHDYDSNGTYIITMTVWGLMKDGSGDTCVFEYIDTIVVDDCSKCVSCALVPDFDYTLDPDSCAVTFSNTSTMSYCAEIVDVLWDFGDSTADRGMNVTHEFAGSGTYTVCMKNTSVYGTDTCVEYRCKEITIGCSSISIVRPPGWGKGKTVKTYPEKGKVGLEPNPTTGIFRITGTSSARVHVVITNTAGSVVFNEIVEDPEIDLEEFAAGHYLVTVLDGAVLTTLPLVVE